MALQTTSMDPIRTTRGDEPHGERSIDTQTVSYRPSTDQIDADEPEQAPVSQQRVAAYYEEEEGLQTATVAEYVRVEIGNARRACCFGPVERPMLGWTVAEIDWDARSMLLAPVDALYDAELFDDEEHRLAGAKPAAQEGGA